MRFLIAASLHHPEELTQAKAAQPPDAPPLLFPPSQGAYFWSKALRQNGHEVQGFVRNLPARFGLAARRSQRWVGLRLFSKIVTSLNFRAPKLNPDYRLRNRRLLAQVEAFRPDALLLSGDNRVIFSETLAQVRARYGCKVIYLSGVSPIVFAGAMERAAAPLYDLAVVNDYYHGIQWLELGAKQMITLPMSACDPDFHRPAQLSASEQAAYACEVGFVGTLMPNHLYSERVAALAAVADLGLGIWSIHGVPANLRANYRGEALGEKMLRILCGSQIQVNPHGNFMRYGGNMRLFEAAACGVFQISDQRPGTSQWFTPGQHIALYENPADLRRLTQHYLANPAQRLEMAAAAQAHVYQHHTYNQRMAQLADLVAALPKP
jgi:spore maturation protein CgeB